MPWPRERRPSRRPSDNWFAARCLKSPHSGQACGGHRTQCRRCSVSFPNTTAFRSWATASACGCLPEPAGRHRPPAIPHNPVFASGPRMEKAARRMKNPSTSVHEALALRRMSLVQHIIELIHQHWPLSAALDQIAASHPLPGDNDSPPQFVAKRTLEDWYYAVKRGGFDALKPKQRSDRGKPRRLSSGQQRWILERVRSFPGVPVKLLYRQTRRIKRRPVNAPCRCWPGFALRTACRSARLISPDQPRTFAAPSPGPNPGAYPHPRTTSSLHTKPAIPSTAKPAHQSRSSTNQLHGLVRSCT